MNNKKSSILSISIKQIWSREKHSHFTLLLCVLFIPTEIQAFFSLLFWVKRGIIDDPRPYTTHGLDGGKE